MAQSDDLRRCGNLVGCSRDLGTLAAGPEIARTAETDAHERSENRYYRALFNELRRLGYAEGQNLEVEYYGKEQSTSDPAALAAQVVRGNPDVIYVVGIGAMMFKRATAKTPIVALTGDPVATGLVESLA